MRSFKNRLARLEMEVANGEATRILRNLWDEVLLAGLDKHIEKAEVADRAERHRRQADSGSIWSIGNNRR